MAMRHPTIAPNSFSMAGFVVATLPSAITSPFSSSTQYRLDRSPKSIPMVHFFVRAATWRLILAVLIFSTAGLLSAPPVRLSWGAYRIPLETGLLIPSIIGSACGRHLRAFIAFTIQFDGSCGFSRRTQHRGGFSSSVRVLEWRLASGDRWVGSTWYPARQKVYEPYT